MAGLRIALPNKGRLAENALELFDKAGLSASFRADRALVARLGDRYEAIFVRAADISEIVADGAAELGITGADLIAEADLDLHEVLDLGFGRCRLIVAVKEDHPATTVEQISAGTRIATSFPGLTARYFKSLGVAVEIAPMSGAVETAPHLGVADVIVDLSSTGSTLRVNGLREVATVLSSSARLCANPTALADRTIRPGIDALIQTLESVLRADKKRYLMANVPRERLDDVRKLLPGISGPTVVDVLDRDRWVAAHAVVDAVDVFDTTLALKALGAEGILVTRIERLLP